MAASQFVTLDCTVYGRFTIWNFRLFADIWYTSLPYAFSLLFLRSSLTSKSFFPAAGQVGC